MSEAAPKATLQETKNRYCNSDDRLDMGFSNEITGYSNKLDIDMAHLWCPDILSRAATEDGAAALWTEKKKENTEGKWHHKAIIQSAVLLFLSSLVLGAGMPKNIFSGSPRLRLTRSERTTPICLRPLGDTNLSSPYNAVMLDL